MASTTTTNVNLTKRAKEGKLTVEEVNAATKEKLEEDMDNYGNTVLYCATYKCPIEVIEAILDKNVDIDGLSGYVSIIVGIYYKVMVIKLTLFNI
jgi:hypothetical protein